MTALTTLIFDVDGTLADTERDGHRVAFNKAFAEAGLEWNWHVALYADLLSVTGGKERIQFFIHKYLPDFKPKEGLAEFTARLHKRKTHFYLEMLKRGDIPLRTGVKRLLQEAREAGLRLGIATTTTPDNVTYLLRSTLGNDALAWFECIAAGDIVPAKKPAPDIYDYAMQQMGVKPEECLAFEDSDNGLKAALGAGLKTLVTINDYTQAQDFTGALVVLDQLGEPDRPFKILQGQVENAQWVTPALLYRLHQST